MERDSFRWEQTHTGRPFKKTPDHVDYVKVLENISKRVPDFKFTEKLRREMDAVNRQTALEQYADIGYYVNDTQVPIYVIEVTTDGEFFYSMGRCVQDGSEAGHYKASSERDALEVCRDKIEREGGIVI